jgi:hypothetical protein
MIPTILALGVPPAVKASLEPTRSANAIVELSEAPCNLTTTSLIVFLMLLF